MSYGRYDPTVFATSAKKSLINNRMVVLPWSTIVHALRQRDENIFLFLLETAEGNTLSYRSIEVNFPDPVMCDPVDQMLIYPTKSRYDESKIQATIKKFKLFSSSMCVAENTPGLIKLLDEFKSENFQYDLNSSIRDEQIKILNSMLKPLYPIAPILEEAIKKFLQTENKFKCAIS